MKDMAEPMEICVSTLPQLPFVEKYRPQTLDNVVSQNDITTTCTL